MKTVKLFAFMCSLVLLAACGGASQEDAATVAKKISEGQTLTQADYTTMVDYCAAFAQKADKIQKDINAEPNMSDAATKSTDAMASLAEEYQYVTVFGPMISASTRDEVGEENAKKIEEYASSIWFPAPQWSMSDPAGDIGDIVDMPASDTDSVIAVSAGVAVD